MQGANPGWEMLIKAVVVLSIMAIWAITSLFNRESTPTPTRSNGPIPPPGPRPPADPTLRWAPTASPQNPGPRRVAIGDDDILIISSDTNRPTRPGQARPLATAGPRRTPKARLAPRAPAARVEPPPPQRPRLAGVSQNVSQQIARSSLGLSPLDAIPAASAPMTLGLSSLPSEPIHAPLITISAVAASLADPVRLREAFIINEILQPPVSLRGTRPGRR